MLCVAVFAAVAVKQALAPPTMGEIRKGMYQLARKLEHYSDEWLFKVVDKGITSVRFRRFIDGPRHQFAVIVDDRPLLEDGYDGKKAWVVDHAHRVYATGAAVDKAGKDQTVLNPLSDPPGTLRIDLVNAYDIRIAANPDFIVTVASNEPFEGKMARHIWAYSRVSPKRKLTLDMWFEAKSWQLLRVHVVGKARAGTPVDATMTRTTDSTNERYAGEAFTLDMAKVAGYEKRDLSGFGFVTSG